MSGRNAMSDRIKNKLYDLTHKLLIPFFTANYPDKKTFHKLIKIIQLKNISIGLFKQEPLFKQSLPIYTISRVA